MSRYAVYTGEMFFLGYVWASTAKYAKRQAKLKFDLIGEPNVYPCWED